jgi:hypothetical protein
MKTQLRLKKADRFFAFLHIKIKTNLAECFAMQSNFFRLL